MSLPNLEAELMVAKETYDKEVQMVSTCCGASLIKEFCSKCKENTAAEPIMSFQDWLVEKFEI